MKLFRLTLFLCGLLLLIGCSKKSDGVDLWGTVIWNGKPVPNGMVTFTPDVSKNGKGHQGYAIIINGQFDTRLPDGKSVKSGPYVVTISNNQPSNDKSHPKGTNLILMHDQSLDIPATSSELNLVVPDSVKPVVSLPD